MCTHVIKFCGESEEVVSTLGLGEGGGGGGGELDLGAGADLELSKGGLFSIVIG